MNQYKRILVVDNEPYLLKHLPHIAKSKGYEITGTTTGQEGYRIAKTMTPDVILLGTHLPDIDGVELCKQFKSDPKLLHTCVILLFSGDEKMLEEQLAQLESGADDNISKPFSNRELLGRIHVLLRLKELESRLVSTTRELHQKNALLLAKQEQLTIFDQQYQETIRSMQPPSVIPAEIRKQFEHTEKTYQETIHALNNTLKASQEKYQARIRTLQAQIATADHKYTNSLDTLQKQLSVSEQKTLDLYEQAKTSQKTYQEFYDSLPFGCCTLDTRGIIVEANLSSTEYLRTGRDDLLHTPFSEYIVDDDIERFFIYLKEIFDAPARQTCQLNLFRQDGTPCTILLERILNQTEQKSSETCRILFSPVPVPEELSMESPQEIPPEMPQEVHTEAPKEDDPQEILPEPQREIVIEEMHIPPVPTGDFYHRVMEAQIRKFAVLERQCSQVVIVTNNQGVIEHVNPRFVELTGYRAEEVIGSISDLWKGHSNPSELYQELRETLVNGNVWQGELEYPKKDGDVFRNTATISPIFDAVGHLTNFLILTQYVPEPSKRSPVKRKRRSRKSNSKQA